MQSLMIGPRTDQLSLTEISTFTTMISNLISEIFKKANSNMVVLLDLKVDSIMIVFLSAGNVR